MEHKISTKIISVMLFSSLMLAAGSAMAQKVYRWVDEDGEVHYTQTLPPDFEDKSHDTLDGQGIVREEGQSLVPPPPKPVATNEPKELPRDASGMQRPKALYSEKEMQNRMDRFLMLRYDNEQEIEDAMNVEIKQLDYDRRLLRQTRASIYETYRGQIREAANRQRAGSEVDSQIIESVVDMQSRLELNEKAQARLQIRETSIRKNFGVEMDRYRKLVETWAEDS